MQRLSLFVVAATLALFITNEAFAADLKIGVVDVEYVILTSKKGKAAKSKLKKIFETKQKELDTAQEDLKKLKEQLEASSEMDSADRRRKLLVQYQQGILKLQEDFVKHQQNLAQEEMKLMQPILKRLEEVLATFAKEGNFDLVLTRSQHGVVFAKPTFDITEEILKRVDG